MGESLLKGGKQQNLFRVKGKKNKIGGGGWQKHIQKTKLRLGNLDQKLEPYIKRVKKLDQPQKELFNK